MRKALDFLIQYQILKDNVAMPSNDQMILFSTFLAQVSINRKGMMKLFSVKQDIKKYTFHTFFLRKLSEDVLKPSNGLNKV